VTVEAPPARHRPYAALLRTPRISALLGANLVGRLPYAMVGLAVVLLISDVRGSFASAGAVAGALTLGMGVGSPFLGRLVDRAGQTPVLVASSLVQAAALVALVLAAERAPLAVLVACAALAGVANPPLAACLRAMWHRLVGRGPLLQTAFALESTVQELTFILGPLLVAGLVELVSPEAGVLGAAVLVVAGTLAFAASPESRRAGSAGGARGWSGPLRSPGLRALLVVAALLAASIGMIAVTVAAFAAEEGTRAAAGPLLALWGVGSMLGGLALGARQWPGEPDGRLVTLMAAAAALALPLAAAPSTYALGGLIALAGLPLAPAVACVYVLVDRLAPRGMLTEAFTWLSAAFTAGIGCGEATAGWLADQAGPQAAFLAAALLAGVAAAAGLTARPRLGVPPAPSPDAPG
jgi:predicted MFS family arabinose efflux permease